MIDNHEYIEIFTNMISEGFIFIDNEGIIKVYNKKAREIFGIDANPKKTHPAGKLEEGDIVIMATNSLGEDDGNLNPSYLKELGLKDKKLKQGDALISIFRYGNQDKVIYKTLDKDRADNLLVIDKIVDGTDISATIDFINKFIKVDINDESYSMAYINSIGFLVILDKDTKELKFYQSEGYTARNESIRDILEGKTYRGKGRYFKEIDLLGNNVFSIHRDDPTIRRLLAAAKGEDTGFTNEYREINGYPTLSTLKAVEKEGETIGAALKVEDLTELKRIAKERDLALDRLYEMEEKLESNNLLKRKFPNIIGESEKINFVKRLALKASESNSTVLILGESGTGKTTLAREIHENSQFSSGPFVHVNCGSILEDRLIEDLFGIEDQVEEKIKRGYFELADGGTIFLEEIGNIGPTLQAKLLYFLQNKYYYREKGIESLKPKVRIIASSNKNLEEEIEKGNFREDLYYRINVIPIWIPPLRDRMEDIYDLVDYIVPRISEEMGVKNKNISSESMNKLLDYNWPGNISELENILERALNLAEGDLILSKHIVLDRKENYANISSLKETLEYWEKRSIENALEFFDGDKKMVMKALDISKSTLYEKINKYKI